MVRRSTNRNLLALACSALALACSTSGGETIAHPGEAPPAVTAVDHGAEPSAVSSTAVAPTASSSAPAHPRSGPTTVGDVTCSRDDECTLTTRADCCGCCPSEPLASSRAWLEWRDHDECPKTRCEPCAKGECGPALDPRGFQAKCVASKCALVPAD